MNWWTFWRWSDLVQKAILIGLAFMLGYMFFVLIRFCLCYRSRHEFGDLDPEAQSAFPRYPAQLVSDLSRGLAPLKAIVTAAPFLALAGTSYGILAAFYWLSFGQWSGRLVNGLS